VYPVLGFRRMIMSVRAIVGTAFLVLLTSASAALGQQTPEGLLRSGIYAEEVQGDLERAIDIFRSILTDHPESRAVGAKAQLHIGLCLEILGLGEAQQAYQKVLDDYSDHRDEVVVARERLATLHRALEELNRKPTFRKIQIPSRPQNGVLSPDGHKLAFISEDAVWIVPVHGQVDPDIAGEPVRLADAPGVWDVGNQLAWSADGEWIAVNSELHDEDSVYVIPVAGGGPRLIRGFERRAGHAQHTRLSLSPDGQRLAYSSRDPGIPKDAPNRHHQFIYSISTAGGEAQRVTTVRGEMPAYSPDGKLIAFRSPRGKRDWPEDTERGQDEAIYDADLWVVPTAGGAAVRLDAVRGRLRGPVWSPDGRFIAAHHEPGGNNQSQEVWVYPLSPDASSAGEPTKISLPGSALNFNSLAGWTPDGELGVFLSAEMHEALYTVPASGGKAVQVTPEGGYVYPRWSPDGERIYFLGGGVERGYVPSAGGDPVGIPTQLEEGRFWRIPGGGNNVSPDGKKIVYAGGGGIWTIPIDGGRSTRLTTQGEFLRWHPCWSPDGEWIAFASEEKGFYTISIIPAKGGEARQITSEADSVEEGGIAVAPDGEHIAFFSGDAIKTIPVEGGQSEVLVSAVRHSATFRYTRLAYSPDGSRIAFNVGGKIWITPLDGDRPEELRTGIADGAELSGFDWSPDGEKIVFLGTVGGYYEFWLISDFLPSNVGG
jgi:Tol biopolymer transport system component